ncbi:hypothetical protein EW145_g7784 [Phellinidium pouzarii]|uniref:Retrovirus-related Pol polyprotein from transposon TNT 1-94-like beta-barrel domain-containing protein n=1 Tax=Phellinidium pouzarii TaxID=167371 RepID=A0A4S4KEK4_9AGAM|nr:hypothetical protein EW145_g7784 [Phellinidium pouzarii]
MSESSSANLLSFTKLGESNYPTWEYDMRAALQVKKLWRLTSGNESKPSSPPEKVELWEEKAEQAAGLIYQKLEHGMQILVQKYMDDPIKMWGELEKMQHQDNPASRFIAYDQFFSITKKEDESLTALTARDELAAVALVRALPMEYSSFRSALLLLTNFDFKTVKDAFLQEQKNRQPRAADSALALSSALKVSTPAKPSSQSVVCEFCDIKGHTEAQCFKRRDARESILKQRKEKREKGKERANAAQQETSASAPTSVQSAEFAGNASTHDYTNPHSPLLSDARSDWIVDTGATCHMTPHRHWFNTYTPNHTPIQLANNQIIYSVGLGSVRFQPVINGKPGRLLEFERVLHVPDLRNNYWIYMILSLHCICLLSF